MIEQMKLVYQLPKELTAAFSEFEILKHLRQAGIQKTFGFTCSYLFQLIFCLIFQHKSWFRFLHSNKAEKHPAKDAVYRFLNHSQFAWRRFLLSLNSTSDRHLSNYSGAIFW